MIPGYPHIWRFHDGPRPPCAEKSLYGHRGEAIGENGVVPLREYVPHHSTLEDSTLPGYPYGLMDADRIARVRGVGFPHRFTSINNSCNSHLLVY